MSIILDDGAKSVDALPSTAATSEDSKADQLAAVHEVLRTFPGNAADNTNKSTRAADHSTADMAEEEEPGAPKERQKDGQLTLHEPHPSSSLPSEEPATNSQIAQPTSTDHNEDPRGSDEDNAGPHLALPSSQSATRPTPIELDVDDNHDLDRLFSDQGHENHDHTQLQNQDEAPLQSDDGLFIMDHTTHGPAVDLAQHNQQDHLSSVDGSRPLYQPQLNVQPTIQAGLPLPMPQAGYQQSQPVLQATRPPALTSSVRLGAHYPGHDHIPPRKRSKVSRACDECRRKKVKCDAPPDAGTEPCSNCRRSSITCLFSRIPQKRGPSKGYIKELADRINNIEGKLASEGANADTINDILGTMMRDSSDLHLPNGSGDDTTRKRPYSSISGEFDTPPGQTSWTPDSHGIQPFNNSGMPYSANGLAPRPGSQSIDNDTPQADHSMDDLSLGLAHDSHFCELNDDAFESYLAIVHPSHPLLASSRERVELMLSHCPPLLRDAFIEALYVAMQSFVSIPGLYTNGNISSACRLATDWEADTSRRTSTVQLVHLQTLILIAIATDNHGPLSLRGEHGGASKASILGRAVGLAYSMRLHLSSLDTSRIDTELDLDCEENIRVRSWWALVMLDRWNAIATASPLLIPNESVVLVPDMSLVLGESVYHLARLSKILGHFAPAALAPPQVLGPASGAAPILSSLLNLSIELFREVLPADITPTTHPILHLVYWHCRLLAYLYQGTAKVTDILWPCKQSSELLLTQTALLSPLNHHFFSLTALSLAEAAKVDLATEEANTQLRELLSSTLAPSTWDAAIRDYISEHLMGAALTMRNGNDGSGSKDSNAHNAGSTPSADDERSTTPRYSTAANAVGSTSLLVGKAFDVQSLARAGYLNALADGDTTHLR